MTILKKIIARLSSPLPHREGLGVGLFLFGLLAMTSCSDDDNETIGPATKAQLEAVTGHWFAELPISGETDNWRTEEEGDVTAYDKVAALFYLNGYTTTECWWGYLYLQDGDMVNYGGLRQDVFTVAHELGHGVHQTLAARQGLYNADTPLVLAETASVFAEMLVFKAMLAREKSAAARRALICEKLESVFATVFRQVAMNRFEAAMHEGRRDLGELSADQLSAFWLDTQRAMCADSVTLSDNYRIWWAYIPHFLSTPGYVYAYAFGELLVLALYARYEAEGPAFVPAYLDLLAAGGSRDPYSLLAPFGINLDDPAFWQGGLSLIGKLLTEAEAA